MEQTAIRAAGEVFLKLKSLGVFDLDKTKLEEMGFDEDRYLNEGPDKHEQEDDGIKTTGMFSGWAEDLMEQIGLNQDDDQERRLVAEHLYSVFGFGIMGNDDSDWEDEFPGTVAYDVAERATETVSLLERVETAFKSAGFDKDERGWFSGNFRVNVSFQRLVPAQVMQEHRWLRIGAELVRYLKEGEPPGTPYHQEIWVLWRCTCGDELYTGVGDRPKGPCSRTH